MSIIDQLTKKKLHDAAVSAARKLLAQGVDPEVISSSLGLDIKAFAS